MSDRPQPRPRPDDYRDWDVTDFIEKAIRETERGADILAQTHLMMAQTLLAATSNWNRPPGMRYLTTARKVIEDAEEFRNDEG